MIDMIMHDAVAHPVTIRGILIESFVPIQTRLMFLESNVDIRDATKHPPYRTSAFQHPIYPSEPP